MAMVPLVTTRGRRNKSFWSTALLLVIQKEITLAQGGDHGPEGRGVLSLCLVAKSLSRLGPTSAGPPMLSLISIRVSTSSTAII